MLSEWQLNNLLWGLVLIFHHHYHKFLESGVLTRGSDLYLQHFFFSPGFCSTAVLHLSCFLLFTHNVTTIHSFAWLIESFDIAVFISKDVSISNEINNQMKWWWNCVKSWNKLLKIKPDFDSYLYSSMSWSVFEANLTIGQMLLFKHSVQGEYFLLYRCMCAHICAIKRVTRLEQSGIEPSFWLLDDPLCILSHSHCLNI